MNCNTTHYRANSSSVPGDPTGALAEIDGQRSWRPGELTQSNLAGRVDSGQAIIAWTVLPGQLVRWTMTDTGINAAVTPMREQMLIDLALRYSAAVRRGEDTVFLRREGEMLHGLLLNGPAVEPGTRVVLIVDPALSGLPFAALRNPGNGRYLIEDHEIQYAFGIREALDGLARSLTLAGPGITLAGDFAATGFPPLPQSARELESIRTLYPAARVLRGDSVTRAGVTAGLRTASVFHFAGHALTAPAGLRGSRLVLAGSGNALESGEIARLDLRHLRLVVLSACETLTLHQAGSYRMDGLAEAFLAAGAGGVVGSSWPVEDASTAGLMAELYRQLKQGQRVPAALRLAQLAALGSGDRGRNLRTWAAFRYMTR